VTPYELGSLIANGVTGVAAVVAAIAACRGVHTWRQQLVGQSDYELAKRMLRQVYELESIIRRLRYSLSIDDKAALWTRLNELFAARGVERLEAKVAWEGALVEANKLMDGCIYDLQQAKRRMDAADNSQTPMSEQSRQEILAKFGPILEAADDDNDDDFSRRLAASVAEYEGRLRQYLDR
jgi:flagellin-specific chaperone FliS